MLSRVCEAPAPSTSCCCFSEGAALEAVLERCAVALRGEHETQDAVVREDVVVRALRAHTEIIAELCADSEAAQERISSLEKQHERSAHAARALEGRVKECEATIAAQSARLVEHATAFEAIERQLGRLGEVERRQDMNDAKTNEIDKLCKHLRAQHAKDAVESKDRGERHQKMITDHRRSIHAIQDKLSRLAEELYITSDQVTIARDNNAAGAAADDDDAPALTIVLEKLATEAKATARGLDVQRRTSKTHANLLEHKASREAEMLARRNKKCIDHLQTFVDANMDVDLMDVRRKQDQLLASLEDYQTALEHRTTEDQVEARIQRKYEDLTSQLHRALNSVKDDEATFKQCLQDIGASTARLRESTKADKRAVDTKLEALTKRVDLLEQEEQEEEHRDEEAAVVDEERAHRPEEKTNEPQNKPEAQQPPAPATRTKTRPPSPPPLPSSSLTGGASSAAKKGSFGRDEVEAMLELKADRAALEAVAAEAQASLRAARDLEARLERVLAREEVARRRQPRGLEKRPLTSERRLEKRPNVLPVIVKAAEPQTEEEEEEEDVGPTRVMFEGPTDSEIPLASVVTNPEASCITRFRCLSCRAPSEHVVLDTQFLGGRTKGAGFRSHQY